MVLAIGFLLLVSLAISAGLGGAGKYLASLGFLPPAVWEVVNFVISLAAVSGMFALILRFVPNIRLPWRDISFGAVLTAVLFTMGKTAIGIYLGKAGIGSAWGAAGSLVVLVVWIYYSAQIFFFGAMFTHVYARGHGWQQSAPQPATSVPRPVSPQPKEIRESNSESPSTVARLAAAWIIISALFRRGTHVSKPSS